MNPYREIDCQVEHRSYWNLFLDRLIGDYCNCPGCFTKCQNGQRPYIYSKYHLLSDLIPWCLIGKHKLNNVNGKHLCYKCGLIVNY